MNSRNISKSGQKNDFDNLKSNFILKKIISLMKINKLLNIIKYNKKLQKRLNISIDNYKKYYSEIEIELKLVDNKYGKFINIPDEEKEYFHIYFDNSNEEIKRNKLNYNEKVKMIKIVIEHQVNSFKGLFYYCNSINSIFFKKFYRNNITDMNNMFSYCTSLKELNLSNFNTNNVTDMSQMFFECSSLKELNLCNFNTNNVTEMWHMFYGCSEQLKMKMKSLNKFKEDAFE